MISVILYKMLIFSSCLVWFLESLVMMIVILIIIVVILGWTIYISKCNTLCVYFLILAMAGGLIVLISVMVITYPNTGDNLGSNRARVLVAVVLVIGMMDILTGGQVVGSWWWESGQEVSYSSAGVSEAVVSVVVLVVICVLIMMLLVADGIVSSSNGTFLE